VTRVVAIGLHPAQVRRRRQGGAAERGGLGETDRPRDRRIEDGDVVALRNVGEHGTGVRRAPVVHRGQDPADPQPRVGDPGDVAHGLHELPDAAVRERLALQRHDDLVGRRQGVDREDPEGRRAVQDHPVVVRAQVAEGVVERVLAAAAAEQRRLNLGQLDAGGDEVDAVLRGDHDVADACRTGEHVVHRLHEVLGVDAEGEREAGLRVEVDEEDLLAELGKGDTQAGHGRRLADAALLARHRDRPRHALATSPWSRGRRTRSRSVVCRP